MKRLFFALLLVTALAGITLAFTTTASRAAPNADPAPAQSQAQEPANPGEEEPLEVFVPTEKVRADSSISFPVDI